MNSPRMGKDDIAYTVCSVKREEYQVDSLDLRIAREMMDATKHLRLYIPVTDSTRTR